MNSEKNNLISQIESQEREYQTNLSIKQSEIDKLQEKLFGLDNLTNEKSYQRKIDNEIQHRLEIESKENEIEKLRDFINNLIRENESLKVKIEGLQIDWDTQVRSLRNKHKIEVNELKLHISAMQPDKDFEKSSEELIRQFKREILDLKKGLHEKEQLITKLRKEKTEIMDSHFSQYENLKKVLDLEKLEKRNIELEKDRLESMESMRSRAQDAQNKEILQDKPENFQEMLIYYENKYENIIRDRAFKEEKYENDLKTLKETLKKRDQEIKELEKNVNELKIEKRENEVKFKEVSIESDKFREENLSLLEKNKKLKEKNQSFEKKESELKENPPNIGENINEKNEKIKKLKEKIKEYKVKLKEANSKIMSLFEEKLQKKENENSQQYIKKSQPSLSLKELEKLKILSENRAIIENAKRFSQKLMDQN